MNMYDTYYNKADGCLSVLLNTSYEEPNSDRVITALKALKEKMIQGDALFKRKRFDLAYELYERFASHLQSLLFSVINNSKDKKHTRYYADDFMEYVTLMLESIRNEENGEMKVKKTKKMRIIESVSSYHDNIRSELADCMDYIITGMSESTSQNKFRVMVANLTKIFEDVDIYIANPETRIAKNELVDKLQDCYNKFLAKLKWYKCEHFTKLMDDMFVSSMKTILTNIEYSNSSLLACAKCIKDEESSDIRVRRYDKVKAMKESENEVNENVG